MKKLSLLFLLLFVVLNLNSQTTVIDTIDAYQMAKEYDENVYRADTKYKDKLITVTGIVRNINLTFDSYYIAFVVPEYPIITTVEAKLHPSQNPKLANISKGQKVTVRGKCNGKMAFLVVIDDSYILD